MNLLCKPEAQQIIHKLGDKRVNGKVVYYELICGIDYRFLNHGLAWSLKRSRFKKLRLAWDWWFKDQIKIKVAIEHLTDVGYKPENIMVFMICNWKISFKENLKKLDLCKIWNVQVCDCYFDGQIKNIKPVFWRMNEIKEFRKKVRKHNQLVNFKLDPEV